MITDLIRDGFTIDLAINLCARLFVMFCVLPIHEFAHALVATKLGDQTAKINGRLTLNPIAHLDPLGALLMLVAGFGYAKPVPVNPRNFENRKVGTALTALAGPLSNLIVSFLFTLCYCAMFRFTVPVEGTFQYALTYFFLYAAQLNVTLAVFNFIPIPPLDGSRILSVIIPTKYYFKIMRYEKYLVYAVFLLIIVGALDTPIAFVSGFFWNIFKNIGFKIFMI